MQQFLQDLKSELEKRFSNDVSNMTVRVSDVDMNVPRKLCAPLRLNIRYGCMVMGVDVCEENKNGQDRAVVSFFVRSVSNPFLDSGCVPQEEGVWRDIKNQNAHQYTLKKFKMGGFRLCKSYDMATPGVDVANEIFAISQMLGKIS